jgi:thiol-disulfide isomerase/thioredoxin
MSRKLLYIILLISFSALSQNIEPRSLFSKVIGENIKRYAINSKQAYQNNNIERADFLFDSLINNVVNGSYMDNFKVRKLSGRKTELKDFEKPIFLMTYASWCTPGSGEIPALNDIAKKYHKEIDFVILFWNSKDKVKKVSREYSKYISIIYVDEKENNNDHLVQTLKHSLGFPTSFFINKDKIIVDVRRGILNHYNEGYNISFELNYNSFLNGVSLLKNINNQNSQLMLSNVNP